MSEWAKQPDLTMTNDPLLKPTLLISSCLLGEKVRYDGQHKRNDLIVNHLTRHFNTVSLCPEVGSGMSVPRPAINLFAEPGSIALRETQAPHREHSRAMIQFADRTLERYDQVAGFIGKTKSPSCAIQDTPIKHLEQRREQQERLSAGYFVRYLNSQRQYVPVIDEQQIQHQEYRHRFFIHAFTLARFYRSIAHQPTHGLRNFHHQHQGLLQAFNPELTQRLNERLQEYHEQRRPMIEYLNQLAKILTSPFSAQNFLAALDSARAQVEPAQRSALRILSRSLSLQDNDQWISQLYYQHLQQRLAQFKLELLNANPLFLPYPDTLMS